MQTRDMGTSFSAIASAGFLFLISFMLQKDIALERPHPSLEAQDDVGYTWNPNLFRIVSFGHATVAVDWLMIKFVTTEEWQHVKPGRRARQYYDLDLSTDVDPAFFTLYTAGANFLTVARNDSESAYQIISKGDVFRRSSLHQSYPISFIDRYWASEWRIPLVKIYIELFEMNNLEAASRTLAGMDNIPGAPEYLKSLSQRLSDPVRRFEVADRIIDQNIKIALSEREREVWLKKRRDLSIAWFLATVNRVFSLYRKSDRNVKQRWQRFIQENPKLARDPVGGRVFLNSRGMLDSDSERKFTFAGD